MYSSRRSTRFAAGLLSVIGVLCAAVSSTSVAAVSPQSAPEQVQMRSKSSGRSYAITFHSSRGARAGAVQRVIYALDDTIAVPAAVALMAKARVPTLLVAIQPLDPAPFAQYDFTPTSRRTEPNVPGGAESLLHFIIDELQPVVARRTGAHADRVVVGMRQTGLWLIYGLINEPAGFDGYVALDPALDWDRGLILNPNLIGRLGPKLETQRRAARVVLASSRSQPSESFDKMFATLDETPGVTARIEPAVAAKGGAEQLAAAIERAFMLKSQAKPATSRPVIQQVAGIAIPDAREYLQLTPQQRYDLRMRVRALPREQHDAWNEQFKYNLDAGLWFDAHRALHDERVRMDQEHGTAPLDEVPAKAAGHVVPGSQIRVMRSQTGRTYRVYVWEPSQPAPAAGRPVIYVLDGETTFMLVRDIARTLVEAYPGTDAPVVVALGYDTAEPYSPAGLKTTNIERTYDYTPSVAAEKLGESFDARPWPPTGGADAFLRFIERELKPAIEGDFSIDRRRQTLMGHSFGGLFTLNTFFTCPDCFTTYVASSPSVWYGSRYAEQLQKRFVAARSASLAGKRLLITVGSLEQSRAPQRGEHAKAEWLARSRMVDGNRELASSLEPLRKLGLDLQFRLYDGESHLSVKPVAANYGVRFAMLPRAQGGVAVDQGAIHDGKRQAASYPPYELPSSEQWSETTARGASQVIALLPAFPASSEPPANGYPVVYFLGARRNLGVIADVLRRLEGGGMIEPVIAVGLDDPELLGTISQRVTVRLQQRYPLDGARRMLLGYGQEAAAVLNSLRARPDWFDAYAVLSPSATVLEQMAGFSAQPGALRGKRLFLAAGDAVDGDFPGALQGKDDGRVVSALQKLDGRLRADAKSGLETQLRILRGEDNTFSTMAIAEALLFELDKSRIRAPQPAAAAAPSGLLE